MLTYGVVILVTLFGFAAIAFALLAPVYFFLDREEEASKRWTEEALAERMAGRTPEEGPDVSNWRY